MKLKELKSKMRNRFLITVSAGVLAFSLVISGVTCTVYAAKNEDTQSTENEAEEAEDDSIDTDALIGDIFGENAGVSEREVDKEETVYILADANGNPTQTIVTDHLYNADGSATIKDRTNLKDIENVKGDETYTTEGDNIIWQADGNEIYYQGTTTEKAPVTQKVTYYLNGKEITPEELAGKSGKVTIRYDYTNNSTYTETIDGKEITVAVPFAAISAMVLNDDFTNIEVTNARVENTSKGKVVIGYALPGMTESLGLDGSEIEGIDIPEYVEVTADVENFSLDVAMTLVTNAGNYATANEISLDKVDDLINELASAGGKLEDGSKELAEGMGTLLEGLTAYVDGVKQLDDGINVLAGSTGELADGVTQLNTGAGNLSIGAGNLSAGISTLTLGLASMKTELATNYATYAEAAGTAAGVAFDPTEDITSGSAGTAVQNAYLTAVSNFSSASIAYGSAVTAVLDSFNASLGTAYTLADLTVDENYKFVLPEEIAFLQDTLDTNTAAYYQNYVGCMSAVSTASTTLCTYYGSAGAAVALYSVSTGMTEGGLTDEALTQLDEGGQAVATGAATLAGGTESLYNALPTLQKGIEALQTGSNTLVSKNDELVSGASKLADGSNTLADGMFTFNEQAIDKLVAAYNGDVTDLVNHIQVVANASQSYGAFTAAADEAGVSTQFIIKLAPITAE